MPDGQPALRRRRDGHLDPRLSAPGLLLGVGGFVIVEGIRRLFEPPHIAGSTMLWFGIIGLAGNAIGLVVLASGRNYNFNMKAFLGAKAPRHSSWRWAAKSGGTLFSVFVGMTPTKTRLASPPAAGARFYASIKECMVLTVRM